MIPNLSAVRVTNSRFSNDSFPYMRKPITAVAGFILFSILAPGQTFGPPVAYPTQIYVNGINTADFDHDGILDIVVVETEPNTVSIHRGSGTGTFSLSGVSNMAALSGASPGRIAVGDFNGDTHADAAVAHPSSRGDRPNGFGNKVTVHLGDGAGGFLTPAFVFSTGGSNTGLASADLNDDGKDDLVVGSMDASAVYTYLSNGNGTFGLVASYDTGATYGGKASSIKLGDFNGDGRLDVAAINLTHESVTIFIGSGNGALTRHGVFQTGFGIGQLVLGDFTQDGKLDVAVSTPNGPVVMRGDGFGALTVVPPPSGYLLARGDLTAADFDGDGNLDVATVPGVLGSIAVARGTGDGKFLPAVDFPMGGYTPYITSGDFDGDGRSDVAVADGSAASPGFVIRLNSTGPADSTPPVITASTSGTPGSNGWHVSSVTVIWSVTDPESAITSTTGCETVALVADTPGTALTCSATSAGGTASHSITLKIDQTPPSISYTASPGANAAGWNNTDVSVVFACADNLAGVQSSGTVFVVSAEGANQQETYACVDLAGNQSIATANVSIDKSPPAILNLLATPNPQAVGSGIGLTGMLLDPLSGLKYAWYTVEENGPVAIPASGPSSSISESLVFPAAGVFRVCITALDAADNLTPEECLYLVAYDPNGGFVTGGGWFNSPEGAYPTNPSLTGKASFGFVSKYLKGANVPTGETQFQFRAADLDFKSTSYDWLVISGARGQYKGVGTVNGIPGYNFILTAVDGQVQGGGDVDRIRVKIWNAEAVIYDNQIGADDDAKSSTALGGGSIVIHKP